MLDGLLDLSWWQLVLVTLAMTHVTIVTVTVFLHRSQAHRALDLHPILSHFFRFWTWVSTGMVVSEWVGIHRKHHARCETEDDPHSPQTRGLSKVLWEGAELYQTAAKDAEMVARYSHGTPNDWLERHVYGAMRWQGIALMLVVDAVLFGVAGVAVWAIQMVWIPFFAAGVINGIGHYWGYRNFEAPDASTNISPWGILIGGEELHNNHHAFPSSAKLSAKWFEFDIGWMYIRLFELLGLAKVRRVARAPEIAVGKQVVDMETVKAVIGHRMHVLASYARDVIKPVTRKELCTDEGSCRKLYRRAKKLLMRDQKRMDEDARRNLADILHRSQTLATVHQYREQLQQVWERRASSQDVLLHALQEWCQRAEATGIKALEDFAQRLRGYMPAPHPA